MILILWLIGIPISGGVAISAGMEAFDPLFWIAIVFWPVTLLVGIGFVIGMFGT